MQIPFSVAFFVCFWRPVSSSFSDVSERIGISAINGYLAALGDFNGDKNTDLFLVTNGGKTLEIFFWDDSDQGFRKGRITVTPSDSQIIVNVSPSDFDGDGCLDVLITTGSENASSRVTVHVYWGNLQSLDGSISFAMRDQPLVMDANGDLLPDLFGEVISENASVRSYWISKGSNRSFDVQPQANSGIKLEPIRVPHSNAFLDLTGDYTADLYITNNKQDGEIWINNKGTLTHPSELIHPPPISNKAIKIFGQTTFADIVPRWRPGLKMLWNKEVKALKDAPENLNINWVKVFENWCDENGLEKNPEMACPEQLAKVIEWFFACVCKQDRTDHDHECNLSPMILKDGDGNIDLLLPVCTTDDCVESYVYVYSNGEWTKILSNEQQPVTWQFIPPKSQSSNLFPLMTIRTGDYNMDGFYDGLVVLNVNEPGGQHYNKVTVLLENVACKSNAENCFNGRTFEVQWKVLTTLEGAVLATFFDLYENGIISFLVVTESVKEDDPSDVQYSIHAIRNTLYTDACFLKVIVLAGRTLTSCKDKNLPYGVTQAGPYIKFTTTNTNGQIKYGSAVQLSQSAYFALQCPYTVFGLGRTPNFVDKLAVGMPRAADSPERKHVWMSIIPNSQVIVIPYPPDDPSSWIAKLLVTPSKLVLLTGVSLLGICVFIGLIILLLHLKEKREDQKEKRQDAHKFHFDAM